MVVLVYASDDHRRHHSLELDGGTLIDSWECPPRADLVRTALVNRGHRFAMPQGADRSLIERVHAPEYVDFLETIWDRWEAEGAPGSTAMGLSWPTRRMSHHRPTSVRGLVGHHSFAADCGVTAGTWTAALGAAAIADSASLAVIAGERAAFGLCRPPGHHATRDQFGGYCYLNNAAIAAERFRQAGSERVAVLDVDYHHGNGTQDIFYDRADVFYLSIHGDPESEFPYFTGFADETGTGSGSGWNLNLPLPAGTGFDTWSRALDRCLSLVTERHCDALVVSLGVDTFEHDPISTFALTTRDFDTVGRRLAQADLPTALILEGGYAVDAIGENVAAVLSGFDDQALDAMP